MSQNIFNTTSAVGPVNVVAGWDNPLQEVFCNVFPLNEGAIEDDGSAEDAPEVMFAMPQGGAQDVVQALSLFNIVLPQQMVDAIQLDCDEHARNVFRSFNQDGTLKNHAGLSSSF